MAAPEHLPTSGTSLGLGLQADGVDQALAGMAVVGAFQLVLHHEDIAVGDVLVQPRGEMARFCRLDVAPFLYPAGAVKAVAVQRVRVGLGEDGHGPNVTPPRGDKGQLAVGLVLPAATVWWAPAYLPGEIFGRANATR